MKQAQEKQYATKPFINGVLAGFLLDGYLSGLLGFKTVAASARSSAGRALGF
jgi:hypothetical protein